MLDGITKTVNLSLGLLRKELFDDVWTNGLVEILVNGE